MQTTTITATTTVTGSSSISSSELAAPQIVPADQPTRIDLCDAADACRELGVDELVLLGLIDRGDLAAYRIAGEIRFRTAEVSALARSLIAA